MTDHESFFVQLPRILVEGRPADPARFRRMFAHGLECARRAQSFDHIERLADPGIKTLRITVDRATLDEIERIQTNFGIARRKVAAAAIYHGLTDRFSPGFDSDHAARIAAQLDRRGGQAVTRETALHQSA